MSPVSDNEAVFKVGVVAAGLGRRDGDRLLVAVQGLVADRAAGRIDDDKFERRLDAALDRHVPPEDRG